MGALLRQSTLLVWNHFDGMENEYMKRGYLLPPGCKDLNDVIKLKEQQAQSLFYHLPQLPKVYDTALKPSSLAQMFKAQDTTPTPGKTLEPLPPVIGELVIPPHTTVKKLAALLGQKPFVIVGDLMKLGMFATVDFLLDFKTISKVARMHGFTAIKAA
jgi:hypothetical protein